MLVGSSGNLSNYESATCTTLALPTISSGQSAWGFDTSANGCGFKINNNGTGWIAPLTEVNGALVSLPNFNNLTPAAPSGANVLFQDSGSSVSAYMTVFGASGSGHASGLVPDPGSTAGTSRVLLENETWGNVSTATLVGTQSIVTAQSASQSSVTLLSSGASTTTSPLRVILYADLNTPCTTGSNSVTFTISWTDASQVRTFTTSALTMGSSQSSTSYVSANVPIFNQSGNSITYTSTVSGTCSTGTSSYDVHASVRQP
jgi:hypothetical protein